VVVADGLRLGSELGLGLGLGFGLRRGVVRNPRRPLNSKLVKCSLQ